MSEFDLHTSEFTASEARIILQELFPARKLVLSQLTFFNQSGVSIPSGASIKRGRRCYRVSDLLPIALVLALKEQGIPNKNVARVPALIQAHLNDIFSSRDACQISGIDDIVYLSLPGCQTPDEAIVKLLDGSSMHLFWSYDAGYLSKEIVRVTSRLMAEGAFDVSDLVKGTTAEVTSIGFKRAVA
jgi:DNA-binding transcriptional MerR regulator